MTLYVNDEKIEESLIQNEAKLLRASYEQMFGGMEPKAREAQLLEWSKENVIEGILIRQEAKKQGSPIPESEIQAALEEMGKQNISKKQTAENIQKIKQDIELQMRVDRLLNEVCKDVPEPSEEDILKFYNENNGQFKSSEQVRVAHIIKHVNWQRDQAAAQLIMRKVQAELKNGAGFETLAEKYSDCPGNGGDLGYIARGQMVEEFDDVVFNLGIGETSDIFQTRFGFHIAKVYDRKPAVLCGSAAARDYIANVLKKQMQRDAIDRFVDQLRSKAKIEVR